MGSESKTQDLYQRMCEARKDWEAASDALHQAMELFRDLDANSDGIASVKKACNLEIEALRMYRDAVQAYTKAVKGGRNP